jgi:hypothetical protein
MSNIPKPTDVRSEPDSWVNMDDFDPKKQPGAHETGDIAQDLTMPARIPREYAKQRFDWFLEGRYLKIWAQDNHDIHGREFILMDAGDRKGRGVLVGNSDSLGEQMPSGWQHFAMALDGPDMPSNRDPCISLEHSRLHRFALRTRYVLLDHMYIIPLGQHHFQDLGTLGCDSLEKLRLRYIAHLAYTWNIVDQVTVLDPQTKATKPKLKDAPAISPYDMPLASFPSESAKLRHYTKRTTKGSYDVTHGAYAFQPPTAKSTLDPVSVSQQNSSASRSNGADVQSDLDVLADPDAYFDTLEDLHDRLNEALQPILQEAYAGQSTSTAGQRRTFRKLVYHLQSVITVTESLRQEGIIGDIITLVIQDPSRRRVLSTVGIWISDLRTLLAMLQRQLSTDPEDGSFFEITSFSASLLRLLKIQPPPTVFSEATAAYDTVHVLCCIMAVGIISYAGSHCGADSITALPFDLLSSDPEYHLFPGIKAKDGTQLVFGKCRLACLQEFTDGPIWAFTSIEARSSTARFSLSLTLDHFLDLWGPVWMVPDPDDPAQVLSVHTAGGLIHMTTQPVPDDQEVVGEVHCHWTKARLSLRSSKEHSSNHFCLYGGAPINTGGLSSSPFSPTARLLIGAASREESTIQVLPPESPVYPNSRSVDSQLAIRVPTAREGDALPELNCYHSCKTSFDKHIRSQHDRVQAAGTSPSYWLPDTYSVGFSGGQWLSLTGTRVYKRSPGVSYKDLIVTHVATSKRSLIGLLSSRTGVEISACTLNAQRISLWRALMIVHGRWIGLPGSCTHDIGDPRCIMTCWYLPELDTSTWDEQLAQDDSPSNWATLVKPVLSELITPLSYSGFRDDGRLYCALPRDEIMTMEEPLPRWTSLLKDTCRSAAFVVLSPRCLTHECRDGRDKRVLRKCQHGRSSRHRSATKPMLNTAIFVKSAKLAKGDLFKAPEGNDQEEGSDRKTCPRTMARKTLEIPLEDERITIETETEHPQLASIQRDVGTSLRQVAGLRPRRPVYHREYLKGDHWEEDVVAVVLRG